MTAQPPPTPLVTRQHFASRDAGTIRELLLHAYGARLQLRGIEEYASPVSLSQVQAGPMTAGDLSAALELTFETTGRDDYVFTTMIEGTCGLETSRGVESFGPGDIFRAIEPSIECVYHAHYVRSHTITLPASLVDDMLRTSLDEPAPRWELAQRRVTRADCRRWREVVTLVEGLLTDPSAGPLLLGAAVRLLASVALSVFPSTAATQPTTSDRHDAHPDALRRAVAFIESNPTLDMSIADIAGAAYITTRAVQLAFRRHLGTTPMAYLRRVRLQHAHDQLQAATSGDGLTVSRVARDWGFANSSRFAEYYRAAYGVSPTWTLRG